MTTQITLQLDLTTDTTGNAEQVARMIGVSAWRISGDYLIIEDPLLDYRVTDNETYSHKTDRIPNGAIVILVQDDLKTSEQKIEQEIQAKGLNAPRLTPEHIDSKIKAIEYILPRDVCKRDNGVEIFDAPLPLQTLIFCILTLENGFTVTGESACASPENFDAEIGKKIAYENARNKIWQLEGYLLKEQLHIKQEWNEAYEREQKLKLNLKEGIDLGIGDGIVSVSYSDNGSEPTPELPKLNHRDAVKQSEPTCDNLPCAGGGVSSSGYQINAKHNLAHLLIEILKSNPASDLRTKTESKLSNLLNELV